MVLDKAKTRCSVLGWLFLMLPLAGIGIVIEVDGQHYYSKYDGRDSRGGTQAMGCGQTAQIVWL